MNSSWAKPAAQVWASRRAQWINFAQPIYFSCDGHAIDRQPLYAAWEETLKPIGPMSFFHGTRHRGDIVLDKEGIENDDREGADEGAGHEGTPFIDVAAHELGQHADRHRLVFRRLDEGQ